MRAAQIKDGAVINYIEVNEFTNEWIDPMDSELGAIWDGASFANPVPPPPEPPSVPEKVDRLQARLALLAAGKWTLIQPAIDSLSEPQKSIAQAYFEDALHWYRNNQFSLLLGSMIGLDTAAMDALFIAANIL